MSIRFWVDNVQDNVMYIEFVIRMDPRFQARRPEYKQKKKKLQIDVYLVLTNYKYTKSLFLNRLKCNHLLEKKKKKTQNKIFF